MSKSVLIIGTPSCCEECRFSDYELPKRCRLLPYKNSKINDRFSKLDNCPLQELSKDVTTLSDSHCECGMAIDDGWKYCPECGEQLIKQPRYLIDKDSICYGCKNYKHIDDVVTTQDIYDEDSDVSGGICNCGCFCESGSEYEK